MMSGAPIMMPMVCQLSTTSRFQRGHPADDDALSQPDDKLQEQPLDPDRDPVAENGGRVVAK